MLHVKTLQHLTAHRKSRVPANIGALVLFCLCDNYADVQVGLIFSSQDLICTASANYMGDLMLQFHLSVMGRMCWCGICGGLVSVFLFVITECTESTCLLSCLQLQFQPDCICVGSW